MQTTQDTAESEVQLTPEMKEEVRLARRFFSQIERMSTLLAGYPAGHPVVEQGVGNTYDSLYEYFELNDRLTMQIKPHSVVLSGTDEEIWHTEEPKDYCFALSRDGIYLIHILAGIDEAELRRFVEILNILVDPSDMEQEAVTLMFEANFSYIAHEAIDESLAALAGIDADIRDRDTAEEREMIEDMFNDAFEDVEEEQAFSSGGGTMDDQFQIKMQVRQERQQKLEVGSRHFLRLDDEAQQHLEDLKRGFTEHRELEHREGEMLSALLGARPKPALRRESVRQIGEVMGALLETDEPWEALSFLKIIHAWRDKFADEVTGELKAVVKDCFTSTRINQLLKQIASGDARQRRSILQMFDALHLEKANAHLVGLIGWDLSDEARQDVMSYVKKRAGYSLEFLRDSLDEIPAENAGPVLEILIDAMPKSRPMLVDLLDKPFEPPFKTRVLEALRGTWEDAREIRDVLVPFLESSNSELQLEAIRNFTEAAPQHVPRVMGPMFDAKLRSRPEDEVREMATLFVKHGKGKAIEHLESLIRRRGVVGAKEQELAVTIIRALVNSRHPAVVEMLGDIGGDWLVPKRIRKNCKEVAELLQT